VGAHT